MPEATQAAYGFTYGLSSLPILSVLGVLLTALVYLRGWLALRHSRPEEIPSWRLWCFLLGLAAVLVAIASPLDAVSGVLLVAHMIQHLLLMALAPPLLVLGAPTVPLLRGLPRVWIREGIGPLMTLRSVHWLERLLGSRVFAWLLMNVTLIAWHVPAMYELALRSPDWHICEHLTFLLTSVLFWWHVIAPWPTTYKASRWLLLPFLLTSDFVNTAISAFLSLGGRVVYPTYAAAPRLFGMTALADQIAAGSLMWVMGSVSFIGAAMLVTVQLVSRSGPRHQRMRQAARNRLRELHRSGKLPPSRSELVFRRLFRVGVPLASAVPLRAAVPGKDLLRGRVIGPFLRSRYGRQSLQALSLLIAAAVIVDGLFGHQMGSMNLAGIVPWTYARGIFVLALLFAGNLFCMSCPFTLPREVAKWAAQRLGVRQLSWPRALRNKWAPTALVVLFFWAYEALNLWNSPWRTAVLLLAYFATTFAVDAVFRDAAFCKYVCPLGQFNFTASLLSPVEIAPRATAVCSGCATRDCIAGHSAPRPQRGCELHLFVPQKSGNTDCTLCMDCVKACPHDNVGLLLRSPVSELVQLSSNDPQRAGVGHFRNRRDLAMLALVVVAAAFASAGVMVVPVAAWLDRLGAVLQPAAGWAVGMGGAFLLPLLLMGLLACALRLMRPAFQGSPPLAYWALALLPVGFGMWAAHLSFHLITAWNSIAPGLLGAAPTFHIHSLPRPDWMMEQPLFGPSALRELQLGLLDLGLLGTLYVGWRLMSGGRQGANSGPVGVAARAAWMLPWAALACGMYAAGVWLLLEPMQMRGMVGM